MSRCRARRSSRLSGRTKRARDGRGGRRRSSRTPRREGTSSQSTSSPFASQHPAGCCFSPPTLSVACTMTRSAELGDARTGRGLGRGSAAEVAQRAHLAVGQKPDCLHVRWSPGTGVGIDEVLAEHGVGRGEEASEAHGRRDPAGHPPVDDASADEATRAARAPVPDPETAGGPERKLDSGGVRSPGTLCHCGAVARAEPPPAAASVHAATIVAVTMERAPAFMSSSSALSRTASVWPLPGRRPRPREDWQKIRPCAQSVILR